MLLLIPSVTLVPALLTVVVLVPSVMITPELFKVLLPALMLSTVKSLAVAT